MSPPSWSLLPLPRAEQYPSPGHIEPRHRFLQAAAKHGKKKKIADGAKKETRKLKTEMKEKTRTHRTRALPFTAIRSVLPSHPCP
ncbi:hypothetical protein M0R45_030625 [Rubus argutus]|uniref:Uncharacterized protein n=1 Tax=Rubus argutus TaxID=59490 RepID=A0AAW1WB75_RUBAR